jgi:hypothetical protein
MDMNMPVGHVGWWEFVTEVNPMSLDLVSLVTGVIVAVAAIRFYRPRRCARTLPPEVVVHKKPEDVDQLAQAIIDQVTGEAPPESLPDPKKNPAVVALGRLGGLKGGKARAEALSKNQRAAVAKFAAEARCKKTR